MPSMTRGDWVGFTFNGVHSSELGFIRVSDGSRFNETILPTMKDTTVQVPGENGMYYFGSYYTQKPFIFNIAFDNMTEENFRDIRRIFGDGQIHDLILDETPYKVYSVKVSTPPQLKYICFDEKGQRIYKGEGTIQFIAYYPFARGRWAPGTDLIQEIGVLTYEEDVLVAKKDGVIPTFTGGIKNNQTYYVEDLGFVQFDSIKRTVRCYKNTISTIPHLNLIFSKVLIGGEDWTTAISYNQNNIKKYLEGKRLYTTSSNNITYEEINSYFDWIETYPQKKNLSDALPNRGSIKNNYYDYSGYDTTENDIKRVYVTTAPYNLGDLDTDFVLNVGIRHRGNEASYIKLELRINNVIKKELIINIEKGGVNKTYQIDTKKRLILQYDQGTEFDSQNVYEIDGNGIVRNNWITKGDFFKLPNDVDNEVRLRIYVGYKNSSGITNDKALIQEHYPFDWDIQYDYLYY